MVSIADIKLSPAPTVSTSLIAGAGGGTCPLPANAVARLAARLPLILPVDAAYFIITWPRISPSGLASVWMLK